MTLNGSPLATGKPAEPDTTSRTDSAAASAAAGQPAARTDQPVATGQPAAATDHATPDRVAEVREAWAIALKHTRFGNDDDFFDVVGGHSLLVASIMGRLSRAVGRRLSLRTFFDNPSVHQLAAALDAGAEQAGQRSNAS